MKTLIQTSVALAIVGLCIDTAGATDPVSYPTSEPFNYAGNVGAASTFVRPAENCSGSTGAEVGYQVTRFRVNEDGNFMARSYQENFDGVLLLYENDFDPANPGANCIGFDDDDEDTRSSLIETVFLESGQDYFLVTAGFNGAQNGAFRNSIVGDSGLTSPDEVSFDGTNATGERFLRPFFDCSGRSTFSTAYLAQPFSVNVSGNYDITQDQDFDGLILLYEGEFSPASPFDGCLGGNDDAPNVGVSAINGQALTAGRTYTLVSTGYDDVEEGAFQTTVAGPGLVTLGEGELEPAAMTGLWYDPALDGSGFNVLSSGVGIIITYYGYYDGAPVWLISELYTDTVMLNRYITLNLSVGEAGDLGTPQAPGTLPRFGTVVMRFIDCQTAEAEVAGVDFLTDFQEFKLTRLLGSLGPDC